MKGKKLKLITEILAILVICLVSFVGVYKQDMNKMQNQVKGYDFSKDLKELQIDEKDIRIDVMRASGNGGQCVNTTDSAVRLTHYPTGIVIYSQTEKSQLQNKNKAFALLRAKLYDLKLQEQQAKEKDERLSQIGTGDRSEKIRTYNFPQGRVTDHRIGLTIYRLDDVMNGDLTEILDALIAEDQSKKLARLQG